MNYKEVIIGGTSPALQQTNTKFVHNWLHLFEITGKQNARNGQY